MEEHKKIADKLGLSCVLETEHSGLFVGPLKDKELYRKAVENIKLPRHHAILIGNVECYPKRYTQFFSDKSEGYSFTGSIARAEPFTIEKKDEETKEEKEERRNRRSLKRLMKQINKDFGEKYNGALVNRYVTDQNQSDYIGKHSDDERHLGKGGVVGIVYGITRKFRIKRKGGKIEGKNFFDVDIPDGSIVWMAGLFQREFTHEIPIEKRRHGIRTSVTFRYHKV